MIRFYRYVIYKTYSWRLRKKDDTPIGTVVLTLSMTHFFQLLSIHSISHALWEYPDYLLNANKLYVALFFFAFAGLHYLLLYNKERWQAYINEFKNESEAESKKGTLFVIAYLIGCGALLFFILMPILFGF